MTSNHTAGARHASPTGSRCSLTVEEPRDPTDRHRLALRRATIDPGARRHTSSSSAARSSGRTRNSSRCAKSSGTSARSRWSLPGIGGWFLARQSLSPVVAMVDRARKIGAGNLGERLPVGNRRDELGRLAADVQRPARPARRVDGPAAAVHGRRLARTAHAGGDGADGGQRRAAASLARRAANIAKRSTSSSSRPPACRASSTTCSRWRGPTPATIRSAGRRCTSMRSSRRWCAPRGCSPARRRCRSRPPPCIRPRSPATRI